MQVQMAYSGCKLYTISLTVDHFHQLVHVAMSGNQYNVLHFIRNN